MSRLIVASNRVTFPGPSAAGGLAVALEQALRGQGGIWVGWNGEVSDIPTLSANIRGNINYMTTEFNQETHDQFYVGYCNSALWPLFHYKPDMMRVDGKMFESYQLTNKRFAEYISMIARHDDVVWVHDYHLILLGHYLRKKKPHLRSGFFLHIPFPGPEVFSVIPQYRELVTALCEYDIIGFQTQGG